MTRDLNREQRRLLGVDGQNIDQLLSKEAQPAPEYTVPITSGEGKTELTPVSVATVLMLSQLNQTLVAIAVSLQSLTGQQYAPVEEAATDGETSGEATATD